MKKRSNSKRKTLFLSILVIFVFGITACAGPNQAGTKPTTTKDAATASADTTATASANASSTAPADAAATTPDDTNTNGSDSSDKTPAIDFTTTLLNGDSVKLSDYKGKVVLLNFWATWCGPCVGELPAFEKLDKEYGDDVVILAVNIGEDKDSVSKFAKENGYTFPIGLDEKQDIATAYQIYSIPATYIIDKDGNVAEISTGAQDADTMYQKYKDMIDQVLKK